MKKKGKPLKKVSESKKSLKDFLADEEGHVNKETIFKIGLATVSGVSMMAGMAQSHPITPPIIPAPYCANTHGSHGHHTNDMIWPDNGTTECPIYEPQHINDTPHTSHCSY